MNTKNILLIGRTGSGKTTLANVISGSEFKESSKSVSTTKEMQVGNLNMKELNIE